MKKSTRAWVRKAESDFQLAAGIARRSEPFHDEQCFHCQQSAEKYLKALLEEFGLAVPRTHVLKDVLALLAPHHPSLVGFRRGLTFLTRFSVGIRYPGDSASKRQAASALRWAREVRVACRTLLGIPPSPGRRRLSP
ncbi:MAG TPA: DNA-binding protein [Planctomycetales bacterium]|jgi:HEPN domain-containing protein|nr:DNA-binding protein [Planctomycetales bacterium]